MGNFQGTVQYDNEGNPITIQTLCNIMNNQSMDALSAYVQVSNLFLSIYGVPCLDCSYSQMITSLQNTSQDFGSGRQWTYQSCSEFGYFQTTDSVGQPFGDLVPIAYYIQMCKDIFGFDWLPAINETNNCYGGNGPTGATKIVFVNGSLDPWHALSILEDQSETVTAVFINGTAHCADMRPERPSDPPQLIAARELTMGVIGDWIFDKK